MQVFDLTRLRGQTEPREWDEDAHYSFWKDGLASVVEADPTRVLNPPDNAHNIAINEESGFAYAIGTSTCGGGGPHMIDIRDPKDPKFAGCVSEDGYTHDTQCVNYRASDPDPEFAGREICFNSNEDTLTVVDVTDKDDPVQLARVGYEGATYTHQAWLTEDRTQILIDDELDEQEQGGGTKTYVFDVAKLRGPRYVGTYESGAEAIDHNQYVKGQRTYQSNYRAGLRVLDLGGVAGGRLTEAGFFDVYPADDDAEFNGTWSNFPYFESGIVIVSGIEQGLFVLRPDAETAGTRPADQGSADQGSAGDPGPAGGTPRASQQPAAPSGADRTRPTARLAGVPKSIRWATLRRRGIRPRVSASEPVALRFQLLRRTPGRRGFRVTMARRSLGLADGPRATRLKPTRKKLGRRRSFKAKLRVTAIDATGNRRVVVKYVRVRR
jgi:choice-of-anchor B domain-containing protein